MWEEGRTPPPSAHRIAIVSLYDSGGAPLVAHSWPLDLSSTFAGFEAIAAASFEKFRGVILRLLQSLETDVRAHFISCGVEEERAVFCIILKRDATYIRETST